LFLLLEVLQSGPPRLAPYLVENLVGISWPTGLNAIEL
jgi:hypothetical protein